MLPVHSYKATYPNHGFQSPNLSMAQMIQHCVFQMQNKMPRKLFVTIAASQEPGQEKGVVASYRNEKGNNY